MGYLFGREGPVVHEGDVRGLRKIGVVEQGGVSFVDGLGQVHVAVEQHEREVLVAEVLAQRTSLIYCGGGGLVMCWSPRTTCLSSQRKRILPCRAAHGFEHDGPCIL